jgi:hypothetical protein
MQCSAGVMDLLQKTRLEGGKKPLKGTLGVCVCVCVCVLFCRCACAKRRAGKKQTLLNY